MAADSFDPMMADGSRLVWPPTIRGFEIDTNSCHRGGCAEVYSATQKSMNRRKVCCKILLPDHLKAARAASEDQSTTSAQAAVAQKSAPFFEEARITASLKSPYVPYVYRQGVAKVAVLYPNGFKGKLLWPYFVMEWIDGQQLDRFLKSKNGPWGLRESETSSSLRRFGELSSDSQMRLLNLFTEIARGLRDAHRRGVAHLDVSHRNVLVIHDKEGKLLDVKIIDWGQAQCIRPALGSSTQRVAEGAGSPDYMAPEQLSADIARTLGVEDIDYRADVYALGGIGYLLLTGKPPRSGTKEEMRQKALCPRHDESLFEELRQSGAPGFWVDLIINCLRKAPKYRPYATASEVVDAIERHRAEQDRREREAEKSAATTRTRRRWACVAGLLFLLFMGAGTVAVISRHEASQAAQEKEADADARRMELMERLAGGDHSPDTHNLAARIADESRESVVFQLAPAALALIEAYTPDQHNKVTKRVRDLLQQQWLPEDVEYVALFTKLATVHELLGGLVDQDGGLIPEQQDKLKKVEREVRSLMAAQPELVRVVDELPPLRQLLQAAEVLNRTSNGHDRPPPPFDEMNARSRSLYWQAERMRNEDGQDQWVAELHYQRGGCHLVRATTLVDFFIPEKRRRALQNDPVRLRQEREHLVAQFSEELRLAIASFQRSRKAQAVTASPRFRLKARTLEATCAVTLLRFVPQLTAQQIDEIQQNLNTFRSDTSSAPVDAQLFSRLALLSVFCAKLTPNQQQLWSGKPVGYRERMSQLHTLGSALLLEWQGAEATIWPSLPQTWVPSTEKLARQMLESLKAKEEKNPKAHVGDSKRTMWQKISSFLTPPAVMNPLLHSPIECSPRFRRELTKTFNTRYEQKQSAADGLRPTPGGK